MSWPIRMFESRKAIVDQFGFIPAGAMWPVPTENLSVGQRSPNYQRDWEGKRPALAVKLPCDFAFVVDTQFWNSDGFYGDGWQVSGEAPAVTLHPSVNIKGHYHGYITNGVIGDDLEGRTFPNAQGFPS